jgi:hypothetical protein
LPGRSPLFALAGGGDTRCPALSSFRLTFLEGLLCLDFFGVLKRVSRLVGAGLSPLVFCAKEGMPSRSTSILKHKIFNALFNI